MICCWDLGCVCCDVALKLSRSGGRNEKDSSYCGGSEMGGHKPEHGQGLKWYRGMAILAQDILALVRYAA